MVDSALLEETRARVLDWFSEAGRALPWRATRDPYRVLVAEVLAQQTQAERAAAAWPRFLERFPDVGARAGAAPAGGVRARAGLGGAGLAGARLQPAGPGPAPDRPGGGGARRLAGHGRGAGRPPRGRALHGPGGGLLRP